MMGSRSACAIPHEDTTTRRTASGWNIIMMVVVGDLHAVTLRLYTYSESPAIAAEIFHACSSEIYTALGGRGILMVTPKSQSWTVDLLVTQRISHWHGW
jgi:hypothetical protein